MMPVGSGRLLERCGVVVDRASARHRPGGDDWLAHAPESHPLLAQTEGRRGAHRARRPVAVGPVDGLELLVCGRVPQRARDGPALRLNVDRRVFRRAVRRR